MIDPRTPVLVGCAQITQREPDPHLARSPIDLCADAARGAATDSGAGERLLAALDTVVSIRSFSDTSWRFACPFGRYSNPPKSLAARVGAGSARRLVYTWNGGNMPQWCVNRLGEMITRGEVDAALIAGGESLATQKAAQRAGIHLDWNEDPGGEPELWGIPTRGWSDLEDRHGMRGAIYSYPMFENAIRAHRGRDIESHQRVLGELLERFAHVAAANPLADRRAGYDARTITTAGPDNPYIGFPYTRLMNSNAFIDQSAAIMLTSVERARALGIAREKWVFLHGCADAHDHWYITERREYHASPAMGVVFERACAMAGRSLGEIDLIDLYSCFPSAVQAACDAGGIALDDPRGLTVTGGMPYFGGPGNNYVTHSIAEMMDRLRSSPGRFGLVTANGNYLTKQSAGIYGTEAPQARFAPEDPAIAQRALDAIPKPELLALADGAATVETYTVMHGRGAPAWAIVIGRLDGGERFIANTPTDAAVLADIQGSEFIGRRGRVSNDGERNLFVPA
ncbi:MAG: acetyl-CoA acetyltransferase [Burkholderiaceae bacterium]